MTHKKILDLYIKRIKEVLLPHVGTINGGKFKSSGTILSMLYDLAEIGILVLAGIRINGFNIDVTIFENKGFKYHFNELAEFSTEPLKNCPYKGKDCYINEEKAIETLHIFMIEEFFEIDNFLEDWIEMLIKYHCVPDNIRVVLDYQLIPSMKWGKPNQDRIEFLMDHVYSVEIINYDNVDFNEYIQGVEPYLVDVVTSKDKVTVAVE